MIFLKHTEYLASVDGHKVIGTAHSYRRLLQRNVDGSKVQAFYTDMVNKCLNDQRFMAAPDNTEWFIYSRRLQLGLMVAYRRDYKSTDDARSFIIMTVYPPKSRRPLQPDTPTITV